MSIEQFEKNLKSVFNEKNITVQFQLTENLSIMVYPKSFNKFEDNLFFIGKVDKYKYLFLLSPHGYFLNRFEGEALETNNSDLFIKKCYLTTANRKVVQSIFGFTIPKVVGLKNSFGFGDRLGLANAGHIRSLSGSNFFPILAQQSIRELARTNRQPEMVMDAAVWAVFQEGYKNGFGSDADHLKNTDDIDLMLNAGFTMFTFDPSEHVDNNADNYSEQELYKIASNLPWNDLKDSFPNAEKRYADKTFSITENFSINVTVNDFLRAYTKYGKAIAHIKKLFDYLASKTSTDKFEIEVSVDETESVTSPFEHFFFANELNRLNVKFISLAPRFIGDFEKGIDYKGSLDIFKSEYVKHLAITKYFGNYKISLHSGSDKFSVYRVIGSLKEAYTHVKTAGTSYLEALKVVAAKQPDLFRELLDFSRNLYETEKKSYHVSADIRKVPPAKELSNEQLIALFDSNDARQVLHVTFGRVLTDKNPDGSFLFKDKILQCLIENEETHYDFLIKHFHKHLEPFK
ncbi:MAG: hypothetical protein GYA14_03910 [Ignavibacteria bacterium]|nr:hypothetical protein [Ignavibacteria bacterium]